MAFFHSPRLITDGLVLALDAANPKSYPGSGTTWKDLSSNSTFIPDNGTPTYLSGTMVWDLERDSQNNFKSTNSTSTKTDSRYTRIAWFNLETVTTTSDPSYIFLNRIGNNADMCLCIANSSIAFHHYTNASILGNYNQDYTLSADTDIVAGKWYMGAFTFDRPQTTLKLYLNGELDGEFTNTRPVGDASSDELLIGGADNYISGRTFDGKISTIQHYNRILSEEEILQNYLAQKSRFGL